MYDILVARTLEAGANIWFEASVVGLDQTEDNGR